MLVGVDIGGTFTDICASVDGRLRVHKVPSTPHDPAQAMLAGLAGLGPSGLAAITRVSHGSTVATNAILEHKGARTALITTAGYRDILAIGRQNRPVLYALQPQLPLPLVPRRWCYEVPERLDHNGMVLTPLDADALDRVIDDLAAQSIEAVAVCFLYSYLNPAHERAVRDRILACGLLDSDQIALSSEVLPEFREYERASTVALEAYVRPVMSRYLHHLEDELPASTTLRVIKSDGGIVSARRARQQAVHTALSGPAAGAIGGFALAQLAGYARAITIDMGGTSTDVGLWPGGLVRRAESEIGGLPLRTRLLDIETIGAGGGSIARLDTGRALLVGPQSAGADPGPIVYGQGGQEPTVTDANTLLGRLDPAHFLGGAMPIYPEQARLPLAQLGAWMGSDAEGAALGIVRVANVNIDRALRRVSVARGHDPREFTLVAFGGAGPLHACEVAEGLQIPRVLVPRYPGVLCALGLLMADVAIERSRAVLQIVSPELEQALLAAMDEMLALAHDDLREEGIDERAMTFLPLVDARYRGQSYELTIPYGEDIEGSYHRAHLQAYGHAMPDRPVEVVNLRLQAIGTVAKPALTAEPEVEDNGREALLGTRRVVCGGGPIEVSLYARDQLAPGARFRGPALVVQMDSTTYVPPRWHAHVDGYRNLILERR
jgi:N-methylhydantoinase A